MKNLVITAWLALIICGSASTARAADWTNGTFSCDLTVVETGPWYNPVFWGVWQEIHVKFYQNSKPDSSFFYRCLLINGISGFRCLPEGNTNLTFPGWNYIHHPDLSLSPGISKSQACAATFDKAFSKK